MWSTFTHHIIHIMGRMDTVSSQMDWELLPVAPLYADVRAYCSHGKMYCKKARLLSYHLRLFISFLYSLMMRLEVSRERTRERAAKRRKQPVTSRDSLKCWRACSRAIPHRIISTWIFGLIGEFRNSWGLGSYITMVLLNPFTLSTRQQPLSL